MGSQELHDRSAFHLVLSRQREKLKALEFCETSLEQLLQLASEHRATEAMMRLHDARVRERKTNYRKHVEAIKTG